MSEGLHSALNTHSFYKSAGIIFCEQCRILHKIFEVYSIMSVAFCFFYCFHVAGVVEQFQKGHLRRKDYKVDDATDIEIQCDLLVIVSIICQFDIHRKV